MLHLILGRLYDAASILPGKIDARVRQLAAVVNGGLTADNLAAGYRLPAASFKERYSYFALQARFVNLRIANGGGWQYAFTPAVGVACELVGVYVAWIPGRVGALAGGIPALEIEWGQYPNALYPVPPAVNATGVTFESSKLEASEYPIEDPSTFNPPAKLVSNGGLPLAVPAGNQVWAVSKDDVIHLSDGHVAFHFRVPHAE